MLLGEDNLNFLTVIILNDLHEPTTDLIVKRIHDFLVNGLEDNKWKSELAQIIRSENILC
jgi:hypothetical protein